MSTSKKTTVQKENQKEKSLESVKNLDRNSIINQFAQTKLCIIDTLDSLTNKIVAGADLLQEVDTAILAKKELLKEVCQIEIEADTLTKLVMEQEEARKQWGREEADYRYNLTKTRGIENDRWAQEKELRERDFNKYLDAKREELNEKMINVEAHEQELIDLRKQVEDFPDLVSQAVAAKEKQVTESLNSSHHFKSTILQKDKDAEIALLKQTISTQKDRIVEIEKALVEATALQKDAVTRVQSIAEKAIEGASKHQTVVMPTSENNNLKK